MVGSVPQRRSVVDWLSVSRTGCSDRELRELQKAVEALVRETVGYGETEKMRSAGNFDEGYVFRNWGAEYKLTTTTACDQYGWNHQGRCAGTFNFMARGSTGIGGLDLLKASSLLVSLAELGLDTPRRIDCTIDVFDHPALSLGLMKRELETERWRIPRRQASSFNYFGPLVARAGKGRPASLYLGSKDSPTQVIVYDKGVQMDSDRPWIRFECRCTGEAAPSAAAALLQAADSAFESGAALEVMDQAIVGIVRGSADIRDVTAFDSSKPLPKNWARSPLASMPPVLAPVFQATAPLMLGELRLKGGLASRVRHVQHSSGRTLWQLCILEMARGEQPCNTFLAMAAGSAFYLSPEDFEQMAITSGRTPAEIEQAEVDLLNLTCKRFDIDEQILFSDKQAVRALLAVRTGGV